MSLDTRETGNAEITAWTDGKRNQGKIQDQATRWFAHMVQLRASLSDPDEKQEVQDRIDQFKASIAAG